MKGFLVLLAALALLGAYAPGASATVIVFNMCYEFSGAQAPEGPGPWLRATFDDFGGTGTVRLTMEAIGLVETEFVSNWYFNIDEAMLPVAVSNYDVSQVGTAVFSQGVDAYKADGDGFFDLRFAFTANQFTSGESMWVDLQRAGLTAASFDFASEGGGGAGIWKTAAHVQGIDGPLGENANSGWVGNCPPIPEPTSMLLLGLGLAGFGGMGFVRRRRNR